MTEHNNTRLKAEDRKSQLIAAAKRTLALKGPSNFGVVAVAKEADVAVGLISHYFGGINGLLAALLTDVVADRPLEGQQPIAHQAEAIEALERILQMHFDPGYYSRANLMVWMPIFEKALMGDEMRAAVVEHDEKQIQALAAIIKVIAAKKGKDIDPDRLARMFFALLDGLWLRWCYTGAEDYETERTMAADFLGQHLDIQL